MQTKTKIFTTKKIAGTAVLAVIAYAFSWIEFPIFPATSFLQLDFSGVFLLLSGFMYGPVMGVFAIIVKEALRLPFSGTFCIGELANAIMYMALVLPPSILYTRKKGFKFVCIYLAIATVLEVGVSLLVNRYINFVLYGSMLGFDGALFFSKLWYFVLLFNLIKSVAVSVLTVLLYKRIKFLFEKVSNSTSNEKDNVYISKSVEETKNFAINYAKTLNVGDVVILQGEMGAGKTAFVKGLAQGLNIQEEVTSPTYAYLNVYDDKLYHYDFYRLSCGEDAERLGLTDYFGKDTICVLEWAENIESAINVKCKKIIIEKISQTKRKIIVL